MWDTGPDMTVREPRGLDFASQEEPKKGFSQKKVPPDAHSGFPGGSDGKEESACQCRRPGFDLWVRKIPWRREWQPLQYPCLENPMDRGGWWATVHRVPKTD